MARRYKGFDVLIGAVRECVEMGNDLKLTLVGDGVYRKELESLVAPHSMLFSLLFSGGVIALLVYAIAYAGIFRWVWRHRHTAWPMVAVTAGMLTSTLTSGIFGASLATGWYLGLYFVCLHIAASSPSASEPKTARGAPLSGYPVCGRG
jgi:hypothetical protein